MQLQATTAQKENQALLATASRTELATETKRQTIQIGRKSIVENSWYILLMTHTEMQEQAAVRLPEPVRATENDFARAETITTTATTAATASNAAQKGQFDFALIGWGLTYIAEARLL